MTGDEINERLWPDVCRLLGIDPERRVVSFKLTMRHAEPPTVELVEYVRSERPDAAAIPTLYRVVGTIVPDDGRDDS